MIKSLSLGRTHPLKSKVVFYQNLMSFRKVHLSRKLNKMHRTERVYSILTLIQKNKFCFHTTKWSMSAKNHFNLAVNAISA